MNSDFLIYNSNKETSEILSLPISHWIINSMSSILRVPVHSPQIWGTVLLGGISVKWFRLNFKNAAFKSLLCEHDVPLDIFIFVNM